MNGKFFVNLQSRGCRPDLIFPWVFTTTSFIFLAEGTMISNIINFGNITSPRTISKPYKQAFISNQHLEAVMHPVFTKTILLYSVVQQELHTKETTLLFITSRKAIGFVIGKMNSLRKNSRNIHRYKEE